MTEQEILMRIQEIWRRPGSLVDHALVMEESELWEAYQALTNPKMDPNVEAVRRKLLERAELGMKKYGVHTTTLTHLEAMQHAQEEAMDLAVYLEQAIIAEQLRLLGPEPYPESQP